MKTRRLRHLFLFVSFAGLMILVASKWGMSIDHWQHADPRVYIERSLAVAESGDVLISKDPPLRYIPLAIIYAIVSPTWDTAAQIGVLYAAFGSYVLIPVSLFMFFKTTYLFTPRQSQV